MVMPSSQMEIVKQDKKKEILVCDLIFFIKVNRPRNNIRAPHINTGRPYTLKLYSPGKKLSKLTPQPFTLFWASFLNTYLADDLFFPTDN
jgi:hypothetical protein